MKTMTKIAYLITYIVHNGPSRVVMDLIHELDRSQYEPVLVTLISEKNDKAIIERIKADAEVIELDMHNNLDCLWRGHSLFAGELKKRGVDIVHSHGLIPDMITAFYGKKYARLATIHNNPWEDYPADYGWKGKVIWAPLHIQIFKQMDHCVCCSSSLWETLKAALPKSSYVRNGVSNRQAEPQTDDLNLIGEITAQIPEGAFIFLFAGRMIDRKNPVRLAREFSAGHSEDEYLIMAGDGPLLKDCRAVADDHVIFPGFIRDIRTLYSLADVYVSASASEGLSISVNEATEAGDGLLLSDIPSHREVFGINENCYLGELFREQDFKSQLARLRANRGLLDRDKIRNMQQQYLSAAAMARGYERVYGKLTEQICLYL